MKTQAKDFIAKIVSSNKVFALTLDGGYAMSLSQFFIDDEDDQMELFCFWNKKEDAQAQIQGDWEEYKIAEISLSDFLEDWCIAMSDENYIAGLDFDTQLNGLEVDSLELLVDICDELIDQKKDIKFKKFKSIKHIKDETIKALLYEN